MQNRRKIFILVLTLTLLLVGQMSTAQETAFTLTSPVMMAGGTIADEQVANGFGCTGGNISPELNWENAPEDTKSFALTLYDLDAPTGSGFWHWVVFNIPADNTGLVSGAGDVSQALAPEGSIQSRNDAGVLGYVGPCPPQTNGTHRYIFTVFALGVDSLPLDETASAALVGFYLNANAIGKATLTTIYGQPGSFTLTSPMLTVGGVMPVDQVANSFGCTGGNISPEFNWENAPEGTQSFALTMYDPDAPTGSGFWHWVIFNIPATSTGLVTSAGDVAQALAPEGSIQSRGDAGVSGYVGPCPSEGAGNHRYVFTLYALGIDTLPLDETASGALVGFYLNANALGKTTLVTEYGR